MRRLLPIACLSASLALSVAATPRHALAQVNVTPRELTDVGVTEHLMAQVPRDVTFRDHTGQTVQLGRYFDGRRPVLLNLVYHRCPMLCGMVLNAVIRSVTATTWSIGNEYQVVTLSIDPRDTVEVAAGKRRRALESYNREGAANGWHFLTGSAEASQRVADTVGFRYRFDAEQQQYAHPAVTMLLTPEGRVARYLYGIDIPPTDLRVGLLEASQGRSINTVERVLLYCYHYDPHGQRYVLVAMRVMQVGGALTATALGGLLGVLWMRERRRRPSEGSEQDEISSRAS
ncbi:MAG: SCO family protein [Myxococcales bacterium]|nr:SCO family protein [Myxococcales bacterium]